MAYLGVSPSNGVRKVHTYTATHSQTTFSGAGAENISLSYRDSTYIDVYQNGVKLGDADYTATSGTSVVLGTGATASDLVVVVVYDVFSVADTVSKTDGGQFDGNVTMAGTLAVTGNSTFSGEIITSTSGTSNVRVGENAGDAIASGGQYNVVVGDEAGTALTTGDNNVAVGFEALKTEDTHGNNVGIGYRALKTQNAGADGYNVAIGSDAGTALTTGVYNTIIGGLAGDALTEGTNNVAIGLNSLTADTLGKKSTAVGYQTLLTQNFTSATDTYNTAIGFEAGKSITTSIYNTLIGGLTGDAITTGGYNVAVGALALSTETAGQKSTAIGYGALSTQNLTSATDIYNIGVGHQAGTNLTTGGTNTLVGGLAGDAITTGSSNVAIGFSALSSNTTASHNTAVGYECMETNSTGTQNTAVGRRALEANTTADNNTAIGFEAMQNNTVGSASVGIGYRALYNQNYGSATDGLNVAVGNVAGGAITTAVQNTFLGHSAGNSTGGFTDHSYSVAIGAYAGQNQAQYGVAVGNETNFVTYDHSIVLGYNVDSVGANHITFGKNDGSDRVYNQFTSNASWTRVSDERYKTDIKDNTDCGLDFINDLRPVTFKWKSLSEIDNSLPDYDKDKTEAEYKNKMYGLIAQEVKQAMEKHNITDFGGHDVELASGIQGISQEMFVHPLIKAVQELSAQVTALQAEVKTLKGE